MRKISIYLAILLMPSVANAQPNSGGPCDENPIDNPFGNGPLNPDWANGVYKIFIPCPQTKVGIGQIDPKYLLDARTGTGRFDYVRVKKLYGGVQYDGIDGVPQYAYPGHSVLNGYGDGNTNLFELGTYYDMMTKPIIDYESKPQQVPNPPTPRKVFNVTSKGQVTISSFAASYPLEIKDFGINIFNINNKGEMKLWTKQSNTKPIIVYSSNGGKILQLDNNGTLHARQIEVDTDNWPDYVFKKGYKLMSLEEVAAYIIKHKHLPNIPAAIEIENGSLNLGNMQKLLMEKIEELTIYTIKQNEQIKSLQKHNQQLQTELNELRNEVAEIKAMLNQK